MKRAIQMESTDDRLDSGCAEYCPDLLKGVLDVIRPKWAVPVLILLGETSAPQRYADIQRKIAIPPKELARILRLFVAHDLVHRTVFPTVPPAVEYDLTERGRSLQRALRPVADWALHKRSDAG